MSRPRHIRLDVPLRPDGTHVVTCWMPSDFTVADADRLCRVIQAYALDPQASEHGAPR